MKRIVHPLGFVQPSLFDRITEIITDPTTGVETEQPLDLNDPQVDHVQLHVRPVGDETDMIDNDMVILAGANGEVRYDYALAEVETEGDFIAYEVVHYVDNTSSALPAFILTFKSPADIEPADDSMGPCESWVTGDDVARCLDTDVTIPDLLDYAAAMASSILFDLSARMYPGQCERTVRPCYDPCTCGWGQVLSRGHLVGWGGGRWSNDCGDRCGCGVQRRVRLAGIPVREITEVKIDGVALDSDEYRLDAGGWLSRVSGGWPICQAMSLPDTEPGTFSVTYVWGSRPPLAGREAARALAAEFYLACGGADCALPNGITSVSRQGISFVRDQVGSAARSGVIGVPEVDLFLTAINPDRMRRRPTVYSPDIQPHARRY